MKEENFRILAKYIKDMSGETKDVETYLFVKENISKYQLNMYSFWVLKKGENTKIFAVLLVTHDNI